MIRKPKHSAAFARFTQHVTDWALAALVAAFILAATIGTDNGDATPSPAVADAIEGARLAARDRDLPEPWPPR